VYRSILNFISCENVRDKCLIFFLENRTTTHISKGILVLSTPSRWSGMKLQEADKDHKVRKSTTGNEQEGQSATYEHAGTSIPEPTGRSRSNTTATPIAMFMETIHGE
jgi:hypothetical protein